jgi:hypothetical protein
VVTVAEFRVGRFLVTIRIPHFFQGLLYIANLFLAFAFGQLALT